MPVTWIIPLLAGWVSGWIVNYLSDVLPITRSFSKPACPDCGSTYSSKTYLLFQRCPNGHARSSRVWLVQIALTALSVYAFAQPPMKIGYWAGMVLLIYFGVVFVIDMEHRLILHPTSIAGLILALMLGTIVHDIVPTLLGGMIGLLVMLLFYFFGILFTRIRANRMRARGVEADDEDALGQGDVILVTVLGFLVGGWEGIFLLIIISILLSGFVSLLLILTMIILRRYNENALMIFIPLGPYFILGATIIVYFRNALLAILPG